MEEEVKWNSYFIDGTNTLKNKLEITDRDLLVQKEKEITFKKLVELYLKPIKGKFNAEHLKEIHKYLFDDIYYFAGEYRNVNISKNASSPFLDYTVIEEELDYILNNIINHIIKNSNSDFLYAEQLAILYHKLIRVHPFREGNGRTTREFMRELVLHCNNYFNDYDYELDFNRKEVDKNKLLEGSIAYQTQLGELVLQFYYALKKTKKEKNINISR